MSDPNMITAYSWAAGLFQQVLPLSLVDIEKRAKLVNEINTPLVKAKNGQDKMLIDLGATEKDRRLDEIAQLSIPYLTEQIDDALFVFYIYSRTPLDRLHGSSKSNSVYFCRWN
ncbi:MAG: hypothetical protein WBE68_23890 [Candidatus Nitrosopolaris sp.]